MNSIEREGLGVNIIIILISLALIAARGWALMTVASWFRQWVPTIPPLGFWGGVVGGICHALLFSRLKAPGGKEKS